MKLARPPESFFFLMGVIALLAVAGPRPSSVREAIMLGSPAVVATLLYQIAKIVSGLPPLDSRRIAEWFLRALGLTAAAVAPAAMLAQSELSIEVFRGPFSMLYWWLRPASWVAILIIALVACRLGARSPQGEAA